MKIVRKIEDINEDCWCRLTEENFNNLRKLGIVTHFNTFNEYTSKNHYKKSDIFYFPKGTLFANWFTGVSAKGSEIKFELEEPKEDPKNSLEQYGFRNTNNVDIEILKVYEINGQKEYIGIVIFKGCIVPMKWDYEGKSLILNWNFHLEPIEYKQRLYTKLNTEGFSPKQKFKVSWTRDMSTSLESTGWRLANNEEIENFKN